ncbi:phospholipase D-like domain-containing protein [Deinococcus oregonensis]|uniref:Phospholipase D-like domain-containing protein n=1 Tax=Deinococcus oregonensis TaxID=1805970 RepID=A0ABV6B2L9_9DEIO
MRLFPRFSPWSVVGRLSFSAVVGVLAGALLARGAVSLVLALIPAGQPYVRGVIGALAAILSVMVGFGLSGALSTRALPLSRLGLTRAQARVRGGVAAGATAGLLIVPVGALMGLAGIYRGGLLGDSFGAGQLTAGLGLVAALYGLLSGGVLGLLTVRGRLAWRPAVAGALGFGAVGLLAGAGLGAVGLPNVLSGGGWILLAVLATLLALGQVVGDILIAASIDAASDRGEQDRAHNAQVAGTLLVLLLSLMGVWTVARAGVDFVQSRPSNPVPLAVPQRQNLSQNLGCTAPTDPLELALWRVTTQNGRPDFSCGNAFLGFLHTPNPDPAFSDLVPTPHGGFDGLAAQMAGAKREVLFAVMEWDDDPERGPGAVLAGGLAQLYGHVRAKPAAYPQGVTVRIALGNFPVAANLEWGPQVYAAARDLLAAGVPLSDPARKWRVEVANYTGTFPHSHAKLLVTDGTDLTVMGFNVGPLHLPASADGKHGGNIRDLAVRVRGPIAADGLNVFDDLWTRSSLLNCAPDVAASTVKRACTLGEAASAVHPQGTDQVQIGVKGRERVFSLYRREGFRAADDAIVGLIGASTQTIDLMHVSFSMGVRCNLALLNPGLCTFDDALPWMRALADAAGRGVQIRALLYEHGFLGLENRVGLAVLRRELERRGAAERLEVRWYPGAVHAKTMLLDGRMLTVGSQNLHYSSWTPRGLNEYTLATTAPAAAGYAREFAFFWAEAEPAELPGWLSGAGGELD